ncbi:MAG: Gfo/Idh/MocA family oxidoreductase [Kineosporiaceae bacterium]|nr:Gfo/Idh/MocA family oxidoreductase [Aeromicrobium sp.]
MGVIGAGAMGAAHVHMLHETVPSARVSEVFDADAARARQVAGSVSGRAAPSALAVVESDEVDAVLIAAPDFTHAELALACIAAGKPVLCEKPLALTAEESRSVVEAEVAGGQQLVQVGFMRRFDPSYRELKQTLTDGRLGEPRLVHHVHRNATSNTSTTDANLITGSMIHEFDLVRWLLDDEVASIAVASPIRDGFRDPQLATIVMMRGTLVSAEVFVNAKYGYDIRCEVVGTSGTASLVPPAHVSTRIGGAEGVPVGADFVVRFATAYQNELRAWTRDALYGVVTGPSAWDGHMANLVAEAGVRALESGTVEQVLLEPAPAFYSEGAR